MFENIGPVRVVLLSEQTQNDIDRLGKYFLIAQYLKAFQEDLFVLQFALDTQAEFLFR